MNIRNFLVGDFGIINTDSIFRRVWNDGLGTCPINCLFGRKEKCSTMNSEMLESLVSRDKVRWREKVLQGASDMRLSWIVVVHSKYRLDTSQDTFEAIERRRRPLLANKKDLNPVTLLDTSEDLWDWLIADNLSSIIKWTLSSCAAKQSWSNSLTTESFYSLGSSGVRAVDWKSTGQRFESVSRCLTLFLLHSIRKFIATLFL